MQSNSFNSYNRYIYSYMYTGTQGCTYTNMCTHTLALAHLYRHWYSPVGWWGLPVMVQVMNCVPPPNKALSKFQDLCTYSLWWPPVSTLFPKAHVPKIFSFHQRQGKPEGGSLVWFFFLIWDIWHRLIVQRKTRPCILFSLSGRILIDMCILIS